MSTISTLTKRREIARSIVEKQKPPEEKAKEESVNRAEALKVLESKILEAKILEMALSSAKSAAETPGVLDRVEDIVEKQKNSNDSVEKSVSTMGQSILSAMEKLQSAPAIESILAEHRNAIISELQKAQPKMDTKEISGMMKSSMEALEIRLSRLIAAIQVQQPYEPPHSAESYTVDVVAHDAGGRISKVKIKEVH